MRSKRAAKDSFVVRRLDGAIKAIDLVSVYSRCLSLPLLSHCVAPGTRPPSSRRAPVALERFSGFKQYVRLDRPKTASSGHQPPEMRQRRSFMGCEARSLSLLPRRE